LFRVLKDLKVTAVLNAAQGSMEDWNYVNTGPAYYQAVGMGMYWQAHLFTVLRIHNILVWIRIRIGIRGKFCYFLLFEGTFTSFFKDEKSSKH
jgi:hypothetical protein